MKQMGVCGFGSGYTKHLLMLWRLRTPFSFLLIRFALQLDILYIIYFYTVFRFTKGFEVAGLQLRPSASPMSNEYIVN